MNSKGDYTAYYDMAGVIFLSFLNLRHCLLLLIWFSTVAICFEAAWGKSAKSGKVFCVDCHESEGKALSQSVHSTAGVDCRTCHGGDKHYSVDAVTFESLRQAAAQADGLSGSTKVRLFDHGSEFRGQPLRKEIPERCGTCHSDVAKMNPYGLPTDQLAQYRLSGHGQSLYKKNNDRVAVCTDCHGTHAVMQSKGPQSPVHPKNVPATCDRCHSDTSIMADSNLSMRVVEEYKKSIHGRGLLEDGDLGMPHCATCHGSHSAIPPGFRDVGHVCGRCHQQEEKYFQESPHAKFSLFPRCVGCHTRSVDERDHLIFRLVASPETLKHTYLAVREALGNVDIDTPEFQNAFAARREPKAQDYDSYCRHCHEPAKQVAHRAWFAKLDEGAIQAGDQLYQLVRSSEIRYSATVTRLDEAAHGILLVQDEALMADEMRTKLVELRLLQHTLDLEKLRKTTGEFNALADQIDESLDRKVRHLQWRHWALIPMWVFLTFFTIVLWIKFKRLKAEWVEPLPEDY
ncbi:MAG: hypothetical protein ACYTF1_03275 [Planctomycetota bacterium]|jgi:hypothetical protein